jgi:hypothetical protein
MASVFIIQIIVSWITLANANVYGYRRYYCDYEQFVYFGLILVGYCINRKKDSVGVLVSFAFLIFFSIFRIISHDDLNGSFGDISFPIAQMVF